MAHDRFLLIKAVGDNLWENIQHILAMLLVCELTKRMPVVYWGTNCLYNGVIHNNAFDLYFERISAYTINDLIHPQFSYFPPIWKHDNLMSDDPDKKKNLYRNTGDLLGSNANVVVSDRFLSVKQLIPWLSKNHPLYGLPPMEIYRNLMNKYLRLKPDIERDIQEFYDRYLKSSEPVLAVHMPEDFVLGIYPPIGEFNRLNMLYHTKIHKSRTDEFQVDDTLHEHQTVRLLKPDRAQDPYKLYHPEIKNMIGKYTVAKIFLITDREDILEEYSNAYGSMLVTCSYDRVPKNSPGMEENIDNFFNKRSKGIEIIRDTYLAAKCDLFIGYGSSSLSQAITHLKDWSETNIKLFYWMFDKLYNFSYGFIKTGRKAPEEADGKARLIIKKAGNSLKKLQSVFK